MTLFPVQSLLPCDHLATALPRPRSHDASPRSASFRRSVAAAVALGAMVLGGAAQAALQDRDLDGDTVVDAFYDTELDITWLRDANLNGAMNWWNAVAWADGLTFGGYSDWRLPTSDTCSGYNCTGSEMGHLWYTELGNPAGGPMTNTGGFQNLLANDYWSGTEYAPDAFYAWEFRTNFGHQAPYGKGNLHYAMAVRGGDVAAIPEPETVTLMLAGLAGLAAMTRRRPG